VTIPPYKVIPPCPPDFADLGKFTMFAHSGSPGFLIKRMVAHIVQGVDMLGNGQKQYKLVIE